MFNIIHKIIVVVALVIPTLAWPHAQLLVAPAPDDPSPGTFNSPLPREDNVRMKNILPCGGFRGQPPVSIKGESQRTYQRGETIRVHWKETNDHSGVWRFDISPDNENSWQNLLTIKDGTDEYVGVSELSEEAPKYYWADITLPAGLICENCTFRMTQSMGAIEDGNDYFSCADITIE